MQARFLCAGGEYRSLRLRSPMPRRSRNTLFDRSVNRRCRGPYKRTKINMRSQVGAADPRARRPTRGLEPLQGFAERGFRMTVVNE